MHKIKKINPKNYVQTNLFGTLEPFSSFIPVLVHQKNILSGALPLKNSTQKNFDDKKNILAYFLKKPEKQGFLILEHQEQLRGKKLSFKEKCFFLRNFTLNYPNSAFDNVLNWLSFPKALKEIITWFITLNFNLFDRFLNQGLNSWKEGEALFALKETDFFFVLKKSNLKGNAFRMALNMAFDCFRLKKLNNQNPLLNSNNIEDFLTQLRYPQFYQKLSQYQNHLKKIPKNPSVKIDTPPFFEGKKLNITLDLKNPQQWEEALSFFNKNQEEIKNLIRFLQKSL